MQNDSHDRVNPPAESAELTPSSAPATGSTSAPSNETGGAAERGIAERSGDGNVNDDKGDNLDTSRGGRAGDTATGSASGKDRDATTDESRRQGDTNESQSDVGIRSGETLIADSNPLTTTKPETGDTPSANDKQDDETPRESDKSYEPARTSTSQPASSDSSPPQPATTGSTLESNTPATTKDMPNRPPAPSTSPAPPVAAATKRFSSSLSVNKKFLEKAGEKAHKTEPKLATTRSTVSPAPNNPTTTSHPRLMTGKISTSAATSSSSSPSSGPTIQLSMKPNSGGAGGAHAQSGANAPSSASSTTISWSKKPAGAASTLKGSGSLSSTASGGEGSRSAAGGGAGAVWSTSANKMAGSGPGVTTKAGHYGGIGLGRGGGGFNLAAGDFPTAAEAAHAKEARARAVMEQMQARERALQARAAAAAAQNANLLQNLDAFRGVHLDPNAHHWDEDEEDDFLDTTIEFGDGTQYKITEEDAAAQQEEALRQGEVGSRSKQGRDEDHDGSLREPAPSELARLETPLKPGEVEERMTKSREERFGDDYDRSWPPKRTDTHQPRDRVLQAPPHPPASSARLAAEKEDSNRNLFNDRLGRLEPAQHGHHGHPTNVGRRRLSSGADRTSQDLPPHLLDRRDPSFAAKSTMPPRRPSVTSRHQELQPPPLVTRNAWPRRPSNDLPVPAHGGRQLPPHLAAAASQNPPSTTSSSAPRGGAPTAAHAPAPAPSKVLSPTQAPASLPEPSQPVAAPAAEAAPMSEADLEALHAREMHAAAERAKKRRQEEEQARLEQIERAKKKAAELEEKMKQKSSESVQEKKKPDEATADRAKDKANNPWRTTAKPPAPAPAPAPPNHAQPQQSTVTPAPSSHAQQPTSILARPAQEKSVPAPSAALPPSQPASWRRTPSATQSTQPPTGPRAQQRQVPPHLAQSVQSRTEPPAPAVASPPAVESKPAAIASPPASAPHDGPTSPPLPLTSPPTVPSSPSHERKSSGKSNPLGYKVPEVSQLDDLMSRIKGAMTVKGGQPGIGKAEEEDEYDLLEQDVRSEPTVKLPSAAPVSKSARSRSNDVALAEPKGRGRGRAEASKNSAKAAAPAFEDREPRLPFAATGRARSRSPPPAWKAYAVKIPPRSPHKAPHYRTAQLFLSIHTPRPVHDVFSSNPLIPGINPRRLNRDDMLIPKKYVKGVPQCPVRIPSDRITRRTQEEEQELAPPPSSKPVPTVSISSKSALVRAEAVTVEASKGVEHDTRDHGSELAPNSKSWGRSDEATATELNTGDAAFGSSPVDGLQSRPHGAAALDGRRSVSSPIGFYGQSGSRLAENAAESPKSNKLFMKTRELNGEKVAAAPREETTPPGAETASRSKMTPSSPPFKPKDVASVISSPSAAWSNKSLGLSVLDPTASSVWSATPVDSTVHARAISENQPENSLQGIVDDDPSVALPSSLAELKSEDEHSNEGKETSPSRQPAPFKDDAKLRAVAPSFSSFLHDSAAAIDATPASASTLPPIPSFPGAPQYMAGQHRPQPLAFPGHHSIPPQSTPSPVNPYSPSATAYNSHLYGAGQYPRSYPSTYGLPSAASVSPFLSQPAQHFQPPSPVTAPLGYPPSHATPSPNLYARPLPSAAQSIPHGITNPALIANFTGGYGQNVLNSARYGAVGAGPRPNVAAQPPATNHSSSLYSHHQHRSSYSSTAQGPSYLSQPSPYVSNANASPSYMANSSSFRSHDPYHAVGASSYDYPSVPPSASSPGGYPTTRGGGGGGGSGGASRTHGHGHSSSTTMPSPVIVPQHLPPPLPFANMAPHSHAAIGFGEAGAGGAVRTGTNRFASGNAPGGGRPW